MPPPLLLLFVLAQQAPALGLGTVVTLPLASREVARPREPNASRSTPLTHVHMVTVAVGTPPQLLSLELDSGSSDTGLLTPCAAAACGTRVLGSFHSAVCLGPAAVQRSAAGDQ